MSARYAIYYAPESVTALWQRACAWLGRDATDNAARAHPIVEGLTRAEIASITARPRRYGFHATLKAPFVLRDGFTEEALRTALSAFARKRRSFSIALSVETVADFLALTLREPCVEMDDLAASCVEAFDRFRAPLTPEAMERRLRGGLSPRQQALLKRWGYPYVMDEFRFHMTLTNSLQDAELKRMRPILENLLGPILEKPVLVNAVALFVQPDPDSNFVIAERFRFQY